MPTEPRLLRRLAIAALVVAAVIPFVGGIGAMMTAISVGVARVLLALAIVLAAVGVVTLVRQR